MTGLAPLQYVKNIRLHMARMFLLHDGLTIAEAAKAVGYESSSQFSREFKRQFGAGPAAATVALRSAGVRLE